MKFIKYKPPNTHREYAYIDIILQKKNISGYIGIVSLNSHIGSFGSIISVVARSLFFNIFFSISHRKNCF